MTVILEIHGAAGMEIWGTQWIKMLGILYEGCTFGVFGKEGMLIGGKSPEGVAARVRVQLEIEKTMSKL